MMKLIIFLVALTNVAFSQATFTDTRDGNVYEMFTIGSQTWMAEELRYELPTSISKCKVGATYYSYQDALTACPAGWRLPTDWQWRELEVSYGANPINMGVEGWRGIHADHLKFGEFQAKPTGYIQMDGEEANFHDIGEMAYYWSNNFDRTRQTTMVYSLENKNCSVYRGKAVTKDILLPVRCVKIKEEECKEEEDPCNVKNFAWKK